MQRDSAELWRKQEVRMQAYDCYDVTGKQIVIHTRSTDRLTEMVTDSTLGQESRDAARDLLEYAATQIDKSSQLPPLDQAANRMVLELAISDCFPLGSVSRLSTETVNGVKRQSIV
jgi:hypothetical protein